MIYTTAINVIRSVNENENEILDIDYGIYEREETSLSPKYPKPTFGDLN